MRFIPIGEKAALLDVVEKPRIGAERRHLRKEQQNVRVFIGWQAVRIIQPAKRDEREQAGVLVAKGLDARQPAVPLYSFDVLDATRAQGSYNILGCRYRRRIPQLRSQHRIAHHGCNIALEHSCFEQEKYK